MTQDELLQKLIDNAAGDGLAEDEVQVMKLLLEDKQKSAELEETKSDNKKRRIGDWIRWGIGGLAGGLLAWTTFYYEDNGFVSGSRGKVLGKLVDKAIFRKN